IEDLRCLPGVGEYTAAAIASFAFNQAHVVLDINVRRLFERAVGGRANPSAAASVAERERAAGLMPDDAQAPTWAAATMELGALVCTARDPACHACPTSDHRACRTGWSPEGAAARSTSHGDGAVPDLPAGAGDALCRSGGTLRARWQSRRSIARGRPPPSLSAACLLSSTTVCSTPPMAIGSPFPDRSCPRNRADRLRECT